MSMEREWEGIVVARKCDTMYRRYIIHNQEREVKHVQYNLSLFFFDPSKNIADLF